ncbi:hypothetical protein [uncultured Kordia sp.]|uniref:hypothetical protein n=1 Tax=uncultured Kordia sp. TaxID=507699 RepID=UPI002605B8DD|nr:hypothetical protein [uncultured Kordia sp.]
MITLKDYIGKIYKEITNAKVQSDIETLAIADEYVNNPMLKHFSVPNIRIKNVELTIPVAVDNTQTVTRNYSEREIQEVYEKAFFKVNSDLIPNKTEQQVEYINEIRSQVSQIAKDYSVKIATDLETVSALTVQNSSEATLSTKRDSEVAVTRDDLSPVSPNSYSTIVREEAEKFASKAYSAFVGSYIEEATFRNAMVLEIESNLQQRLPEIEELPVIIETQKLKEINDPASMINIKVNIMDDAMEWTTDVDAEGNTVQVLNYE